jgi:hypothetical protein
MGGGERTVKEMEEERKRKCEKCGEVPEERWGNIWLGRGSFWRGWWKLYGWGRGMEGVGEGEREEVEKARKEGKEGEGWECGDTAEGIWKRERERERRISFIILCIVYVDDI